MTDDEITSTTEAALILGISPSAVRMRVKRGTMPPRPWPRAELEAQAPDRGPVVIEHGTRRGYESQGCRCELCTAENARVHREQVHRGWQQIPDDIWAAFLDDIRGGMSMKAAAEVRRIEVFPLRRRLAGTERLAELDEALMEGRDPELSHGRPGTYTAGCRCPECLEAFRRYT